MIAKRWMVFAAGLLAGAAMVGIAVKLGSKKSVPGATTGATAKKAVYQCPMHPSVVSSKPENCPICGMALQRMDDATPGGNTWRAYAPGTEREEVLLARGMRPAPRVGSTAFPEAPGGQAGGGGKGRGRVLYYRHPMRPDVISKTPSKDEMGMDYVPVYDGEEGGESEVPGHAVVKLPKWRRQLIGIKTVEARRRALETTIRAVGRIAYDPDLYTAMSEHREALISRDKVKDSSWPDVHERAEAMVRASELKLKLMGLSEDQIAQVYKDSAAPVNLLFGAPGGTLWVYAEIYEYEVGLVSVGQPVDVTLPAFPGRTIRGRVKAVDPTVNPATRSVRIRAEIPNLEGKLKPEMFVNVSIRVPLGEALGIPVDAVFDTGTRQLVFVEEGEGEFQPREIKRGRQANGFYQILSGLQEGERVVTQANFLLDSESKLRAAGAKAGGDPSGTMQGMPGMKDIKGGR